MGLEERRKRAADNCPEAWRTECRQAEREQEPSKRTRAAEEEASLA